MCWPGPVRSLQFNVSLFFIPPEPKNRCVRAAGNGRLITSLMGNGRQIHKFSSPKNLGGILFLVLMETHAGRNQGGMRKN